MDSRVWANYLSALKKNSHSNGAQLTASYRVGCGELAASGSTAVYDPTLTTHRPSHRQAGWRAQRRSSSALTSLTTTAR